jgi:hypothetical protein
MATKPKNPLYVTPAGTAQYPYLNKPDTKFNVDGEYKVTLDVPSEDAAQLIQQLEEAHDKSIAAAKDEAKGKRVKEGDLPFTVNADAGTVSFKFKLKAKVTPKKGDPFEQKPAIVDAKRQPLSANTVVGGGSKLKIAFEIIPYYTAIAGAGISLRLKAAQVIELRAFGGGASAAAGVFGEEDGFEDEGAAAGAPFDTDETSGSTNGDSQDF